MAEPVHAAAAAVPPDEKRADRCRPRCCRKRHGVTSALEKLAAGAAILGAGLIVMYAFATPGPHCLYLAIGLSVGLAAQVTGALAGFLFGVPKAAAPLTDPKAAAKDRDADRLFVANTNLADVSDWLTKLLLGAGLVELTRLGRPVGKLIASVAGALHSSSAGATTGPATVIAGSLLFGGVAVGFLEGYVLTTLWYPRKLNGNRHENDDQNHDQDQVPVVLGPPPPA